MSKRYPNPFLAMLHRTYTAEDVVGMFGTHRNTVREWIKRRLPTSDDRSRAGRSLLRRPLSSRHDDQAAVIGG